MNARAWFYSQPGFHLSAVPDVTLPAMAGDEPAPTLSSTPEAAGKSGAAAAHLCDECGSAGRCHPNCSFVRGDA